MENTYSKGGDGDADDGHEEGRDTEQAEGDEADQERQHDGGIQPV